MAERIGHASCGGAIPDPITQHHRVFHCFCHGQWAGRCRTGLPAGRANRAGTLTRSRRSVTPRATAWLPPARVPAAEQVVRDRRTGHPGAVRRKPSRGDVGERSVDQVREHRFHDRVLAVGEVGVDGRQVGIGEERVIPPHREQRIRVVGVLDPAHNEAGGDLVASGERGVRGLGDLGVGDQLPGVGVGDRTFGSAPGPRPARRWRRWPG